MAAASGWWLASRQIRRPGRGTHRSNPDFSHPPPGRRAETTEERVEHGMALGAMLRRAGNVDQAILIHQELLERSGDLAAERCSRLQLELAHDYFKAGVVDRAEALLLPLRGTSLSVEAFGMLRRIYEQERDWAAAIVTAREIEAATGESMRSTIAQYLCESATTHLERNDVDAAEQALHDALARASRPLLASILPHDEVGAQLRLYVDDQPTLAGLQEFVDCWCRREFPVDAMVLHALRQGLAKVATVAERYRCFSCGLSSRRLYWQCPGCKQWNSLVPAISQRSVSASAPPPVTAPKAGEAVDSCC